VRSLCAQLCCDTGRGRPDPSLHEQASHTHGALCAKMSAASAQLRAGMTAAIVVLGMVGGKLLWSGTPGSAGREAFKVAAEFKAEVAEIEPPKLATETKHDALVSSSSSTPASTTPRAEATTRATPSPRPSTSTASPGKQVGAPHTFSLDTCHCGFLRTTHTFTHTRTHTHARSLTHQTQSHFARNPPPHSLLCHPQPSTLR
jgi:hypothetical protein